MSNEPPPDAEAAGFSDIAFDARYGRGDAAAEAAGGTPAAPPGASRPATSSGPRSRNSYMRTRARRLAASQPA